MKPKPNRSKHSPPADPTASKSVGEAAVKSTPRAAASPRRRLVFRVAAVLVVPLLLLGVAEVALRLAGYGYSPAFFKPLRRDGQDFLVENDKFGWRFFPPAMARSPAPVILPARKAPGVFRIFVFGESAALGDPRPAYGFSRYLEVLLRERYPQGRFEIVNVGMTAISSHGIREIARECARLEGDLWIVYAGNNEYYGPFGAGTVFGPRAPSLARVRARLALESTRLGQGLSALGARLRGASGAPAAWGGLRMFVGHEIDPAAPERAVVQRNFARNLDDIARRGVDAGAKVILCSVAANLAECGPFASRSGPELAGADRAGWTTRYEAAVAKAEASMDATALESLRAIVAQNPRHAEAQFRLAEREQAAGRAAEAREHYELARDHDAMPFRADRVLNSIARDTAAGLAARGVVWFDAAEALARAAPGGVPGGETFYEHVHFRFDGSYRLARLLAEQVRTVLPESQTRGGAESWAVQALCERRLGLTDWNRAAVLEGMVNRLIEAPYTNQFRAPDRLRQLMNELVQTRGRLTANAQAEARALYEETLRRAPHDHRLHENFAEFLASTGDLAGAAGELAHVSQLIPHHFSSWYQTGRLLARQRKHAEARAAFEHALTLRPDLAEAHLELASLDLAEERPESALRHCDTAVRLRPADVTMHIRRAEVLTRLKRREDALDSLRAAVRIQPDSWEARYRLGVELAADEKLPEAQAEFSAAVRLRPEHVMGRLNLGVLLARQARFDEAEAQLREVLRLEPTNSTARRALETLSARGAPAKKP